MPASAREKLFFCAILLAYLLVGALFAIYTPAWQAPDEPAHYNYIRQVAETGCCPRIETGDWDSAYLAQLTTHKFAADYLANIETIQYEDHHPPLYYLLAALVYKLQPENLTALRLFSVLLGAGGVALSYAIGRRLAPAQPQIALGLMALVAFLPQHISMLSAVNNDALAELLVALALLWLLRYYQTGAGRLWQLGLIVGLALLTKLTIYFLAPLALLTIWLRWRADGGAGEDLARAFSVFLLVALLIGGLWWLRNISVYGGVDFFGLGAHDRVVADQPRSADYIAQEGGMAYLSGLLQRTFKSFWGQFGWMALPLDGVLGGWLYRGFALFTLAGLAGAWLASRRSSLPSAVWLLLLTVPLLVLLQFAYYNLEFVQWQGRYLFPALIPITFLLVYGSDYWREILLGRWRGARWLTALTPLSLAALDVYLLFWVIVPGLSPD